jgi:hypothetical protein
MGVYSYWEQQRLDEASLNGSHLTDQIPRECHPRPHAFKRLLKVLLVLLDLSVWCRYPEISMGSMPRSPIS